MSIIDGIKLLVRAKTPAREVIDNVKEINTKWKKVRFWGTLILSLSSLAAAFAGILPPTVSMVIAAALSCLYQLSQALLDADETGFSPLLQSTKFWSMVLNAIGIFLVALHDGGINSPAINTLIAVLGALGGTQIAAQNIAANDPTKERK